MQTLTTLPNFISWVLVYSVAFSLFTDSGMVNTLLQNMGIITSPIKFLDSDAHTYLWMTLWNLWKGLGWGAIMYLSAIAGIDEELYESSKGGWSKPLPVNEKHYTASLNANILRIINDVRCKLLKQWNGPVLCIPERF
ncbi:MAG: hypothetical protein ACLUTO_07315 [Anaerostipes sp.]